jgi:signal transduction histidine kinase
VLGRTRLPDAIQFFVEDDGRGIAKHEAALVFEPFYRDETSRALHEKGSGLGLFIARRKARLLGGDLKLESPYERMDALRRHGCRFILEIPFEEAVDAR